MNKALAKLQPTYLLNTPHSQFTLQTENNNEIAITDNQDIEKVWSNYPFTTNTMSSTTHILEATWAIQEKTTFDLVPIKKTEDDVKEETNTKEEPTPSHYARRPMNAFLIFCKKHRPIVRERFPNLENRGVTRILGEWWALLDERDKSPYTNLAKEYKDAFLCANPDFKWYKLPAPPLRSLNIKPSSVYKIQPQVSHSNNNNNNKSEFTPGKLADESQLGGLTSLMNNFSTNNVKQLEYNNNIDNDHVYDTSLSSPENVAKADTCMDQNKCSITFENHAMESEQAQDESSMTKQELMDKVVEKIFTTSEEDNLKEVRKSGRQCKGKRYEKFMVESRLLGNKRDGKLLSQRFPTEKDFNNKLNSEQTPNLETTIKRLAERTNVQNILEHQNIDESISPPSQETPETKFNLNQRINNLPSLSYDVFHQKKKDSKKRKSKIRNDESKNKMLKIDNNEMPLTGSKKRKNKQSITHLKEERVECNLLALETLAEIAANTEKINSE